MGLLSKKPKRVALVLGGGATRGLAHIGVIKALEENNKEKKKKNIEHEK